MKVFVCVLALLALSYGERKSFRGDAVYRITPATIEENDYIRSLINELELDSWKEAKFIGDTADVRVPLLQQPRFKVLLTASGIKHEVFIEDVQVLIDQEARAVRATPIPGNEIDQYHTWEEIETWMNAFAIKYSNEVQLIKEGVTFEGREFKALQITKGGNHGNADVIFLNCGIHAREWVTPATCMNMATYLVTDPSNDEFYGLSFVIVIVSNPDGYVYTQTDRMWRKTRSRNGNACIGVDPNRNWDINWSGEGASSSSCNDAYYGPSPMSEKIVQNQNIMVQGLNVKMYVDIHAYSQYWMYPYGYTKINAPHDSLLDFISGKAVAAVQATHNKRYTYGSIADVIYVASGSTADYFYEVAGIKCSFALELRDTGRYGFLLPADEIVPTSEETFAGIKSMARDVLNGNCN